MRAPRRRVGRHRDGGDDLAGFEHRLDVRRVAGQPVEFDQRHRALPVSAAHLDGRIERNQRTARSDGLAAMQFSLVPSTACQRFSPPMAAQPEPGARLLQAA